MQPPEADHDYSIRGAGAFIPDTPDLAQGSDRGDSSIITNAASPTDSTDSPTLSPSPTIPDSNKYKKNMLWRYLNDVTEAHQSLSKDCKSDGESRSSVSDSEFCPEPVGQEVVCPAPAWEPPASDNITLSFTHSPGTQLSSSLVPVLSPPPDTARRHPDTVQPAHQGPVFTLLSSAPGPSTSISYHMPRPTPPAPAIFNPQILRPLSVLPLPAQYPFIHWNQIALPHIPITSLLPLVPDSGDSLF